MTTKRTIPTRLRGRKAPRRRLAPTLAAAAALLTVALAATPAADAAEHREEISRRFAAAPGLVVGLENLAGTVDLVASDGEVTVDATVVAAADSDAEARRLASLLEIRFDERGDRLVIEADYPVDRYDTYHYPGEDGGDGDDGGSFLGRLFGEGGSRTQTRYQGERVTVVSSPRGGAVTLYALFRIGLPAGVGAKVENAAGDVTARGVAGPLSLDTGAGAIRVADGEGPLRADTGSGGVTVTDHRGQVQADTGSGDVRLTRVWGDVDADTGSGDVHLENVEGDRLHVDTGSGDVRIRGARGALYADTGSGAVEADEVTVVGILEADTGSGGITVRGDLAQAESIRLDAGSGRITLASPTYPPMDLDISTGSGGIDVDLPGLEVLRKEEDALRARYQGGGVRVEIDTGSGGVRIEQR
jgi:hypothetical protein